MWCSRCGTLQVWCSRCGMLQVWCSRCGAPGVTRSRCGTITKSGGHALFIATRRYTHNTHMQVGRRWKMFPSWRPPPGTARSSGRPAMRHPGTKSKCSVLTWSGSGPTSICSFCMFLLLGFNGGNSGNTGRTCKLHTERPGNKPRQDLNPRPFCCEATVLRTVPPCPHGVVRQVWCSRCAT